MSKTRFLGQVVAFQSIFQLHPHGRDIFSNIQHKLNNYALYFVLSRKFGCHPYMSLSCYSFYFINKILHEIVQSEAVITNQIHKLLQNKSEAHC